VPSHIFGPVVGEHGPDLDPVTAIEAQRLVDEAGRHGPGGRAEHDGHDGEAGEDVDGGELVHLAHALELADVEAVEADELARTAAGQAEPEGLVLAGSASGTTSPVVAAAMAAARARRWALAQPVGHQVLLHGRLGDGEPLVTRADRRTGDSRWWAGARPGSTGPR
jgi:hypothetical protein